MSSKSKARFSVRRLGGVGEAHVGEAAERLGELVEQAAGLAEVDVLRALRHLGERGGVDGLALPERLHGAAEGELDRRGGRQPAARGDGAPHDEVEALGRAAGRGELGGHAARERRGGLALVLAGGEVGEVDLEAAVAHALHAHGIRAVQGAHGLDVRVERAADDVTALVVRVVAGDLRPCRDGHGEQGALRRAEPFGEEVDEGRCCCHAHSFPDAFGAGFSEPSGSTVTGIQPRHHAPGTGSAVKKRYSVTAR